MAKKKTDRKTADYGAELKKLKAEGPQRLYLLRGEEEYLREQFLISLKAVCLPDGEDAFSFIRLNGPELEANAFEDALNAMPFMSERTFIELRNIDINRLKDTDKFIKLLDDIPDYCTAAFVLEADYELDRRLKLSKALTEKACELSFAEASASQLFNWVSRRFASCGKSIEFEAVQRLIFVSGRLMNQLIPEIEKIAAYAQGDCVSVADVDAVAHHLPEADVFEMTGHIAKREYNVAVSMLSELLNGTENNEPIMILALIGAQMRKLYAAKVAVDEGLGIKYVMSTTNQRFESLARQLVEQSRLFTFGQLRKAVELCALADYKMKSSSVDDVELLKETFIRIAAGESDGEDK